MPSVLPSEGLDCEVGLRGLPAQTFWLWVSPLATVAGTLVSPPPEWISELAVCGSLFSRPPGATEGQLRALPALAGASPACLGPSSDSSQAPATSRSWDSFWEAGF